MAVPDFPIDEAYLIAGWLESFLWGLYTLLFATTVYCMYRRKQSGINKFTTLSIMTLYALATAHIVLALVRLVQGFIFYRDTIGPVPYFADISVRLNMAKDYIYITNLVVGDLVVVWRLYVVWGRSIWVASLPTVMIVGEFVAGYGSISQWFLSNPNPEDMVRWGTAMFAISLATNVLVTIAIALRIWCMTMNTMSHNSRNMRIIILIIDSGAVIAAAKVIEFVLFTLAPVDGVSGLNALYIVYEAMPQITGIAPTIIVYAVNNGFTTPTEHFNETIVLGTRSAAFTATMTRDSSLVTCHEGPERRPVPKLVPQAVVAADLSEVERLGKFPPTTERWLRVKNVMLSNTS